MRCVTTVLRVGAVTLAVAALALLAPPAGAGTTTQEAPHRVTYEAPVDAPVVDTFRPPGSPYGTGNRGIDYATRPGSAVRAAAPGVVAFAGAVASGLHVVVLHADGIRTSSSFLRAVEVRRGQRVGVGDVVGVAGPNLHFGARAGEAYVDPLVLLSRSVGGGPGVRLVPDAERSLQSEERERGAISRLVAALPDAGIRVAATAVAWARQVPVAVVSVASAAGAGAEETLVWLRALSPPVVPWQLALASRAWWIDQATCTAADVGPPPPSGRRIAVLVAGLGSSSENAAIYDVNTATLGYAAGDVYRYSYRGGSADENSYGPADTQVDIALSGERLRALLDRIHAAHPNAAIDVIAHSQGGIVTRSALGPRAPPGVAHVVTLGSPHQGADLATALALTARTPKGAQVQWAISRLGITGIDPRSRSVRQLAETSGFMRRLNSQPLPEGVRFTSIAARGDVVVPSPRSRLRGATYKVVSVPTLNHHNALPGSAAATREIALARAGMAPTCEGLGDALADAAVGQFISAAEDMGGVALAVAGAR
ncbi:MAG: peptidoglycan DD-metalloendopeptidase family protein [Acidimicrobiales bacterium]